MLVISIVVRLLLTFKFTGSAERTRACGPTDCVVSETSVASLEILTLLEEISGTRERAYYGADAASESSVS
jgi:hypothetical protein